VEQPILAFFKSNLRLTLPNRPVLFFSYLVPFVFLFALAEMFHAGTGGGIVYFVGPVLTMGIVGNGLWSAGIRAVEDDGAGVRATPISPLAMLVVSMVSGWLLYLPVVAVTLALAHGWYGMNLPRNWFSLLAMVTLGVCAIRGIGLVVAAVTSRMLETGIAILMLYLPMLLLSGVTVPAALLPRWAQTAAEFMPAAYLVNGLQGIFFLNRNLWDNRNAAAALLLTALAGMFLAVRLFRREKKEKLAPRHKAWVLAVLAPFVAMGCWQSGTGEHIRQNQAMFRQLQRSGVFLIRNTRIFTGEGAAIENGSVLVRDGKIAEVYRASSAPDPETLHAEVVEGAGKTLLPGLIDVHVHLGGAAGLSDSSADYDPANTMPRAAAALLYSGVTSARSVGDQLDRSLVLRRQIDEAAKPGARLFVCGPMFTAGSGHGAEFTQYVPETMRGMVKEQLAPTPKTAGEARAQVRELKRQGVDGITAILEAGWGEGMLYDRLDLFLVRAIAEEAHARNLPLAVHTGDARDVFDAVDVGAASVEQGSWRDELPDSLLERMAREQVDLDPTLTVVEAYAQYFAGQAAALSESLVQQVAPARMLKTTREFLASGKSADPARAEIFTHALEVARANLLRAWQAGVPLVMGTDAGNPLVFHGPSLHHELRLWVRAGIPPAVALEAATVNAAKLVGASGQIGAIRKGLDANLLLVDGNPLEDISATERISLVVLEGERIHRAELLDRN
jgi:imidazolonepropionase-like amidohydrolase/ABC-type polysaccharide/polyol phosphate export permease